MTNTNSLYYRESKLLHKEQQKQLQEELKWQREQQPQRQAQAQHNDLPEPEQTVVPSDKDDLDPDMPNTYVNDSGDPNQIGRSEEEELENNTDIDMNQVTKIGSEDIDVLSDNINEKVDRSIRISGTSDEQS